MVVDDRRVQERRECSLGQPRTTNVTVGLESGEVVDDRRCRRYPTEAKAPGKHLRERVELNDEIAGIECGHCRWHAPRVGKR